MTRRSVIASLLFVVNIAIWGYAGYAIGETRGRGWRGAVLDHGCTSRCLAPVRADAKL